MLDLTRFQGQKIRIGDDITIIIRDVNPQTGKLHISIDAPRDVTVHREEVYQRIRAEQAGLPIPPELTSQYQRWRRS